jgi:hypothetical protein
MLVASAWMGLQSAIVIAVSVPPWCSNGRREMLAHVGDAQPKMLINCRPPEELLKWLEWLHRESEPKQYGRPREW